MNPASELHETLIEGCSRQEAVQGGIMVENQVTGPTMSCPVRSGVNWVSNLRINPTSDDHEMARFPRTRSHAEWSVGHCKVGRRSKRWGSARVFG
eukprot:1026122-Alexandrium_andersonii.AAC.1